MGVLCTEAQPRDDRLATGGVLTGGGEIFVTCGLNFKHLGRLVAEISFETGFPILMACRGPTIGF